jgi:hypothetical protein
LAGRRNEYKFIANFKGIIWRRGNHAITSYDRDKGGVFRPLLVTHTLARDWRVTGQRYFDKVCIALAKRKQLHEVTN